MFPSVGVTLEALLRSLEATLHSKQLLELRHRVGRRSHEVGNAMLSNRLLQLLFAENIFFTGIQKHHSSCCGISESSCGKYITVLRTRKDLFFYSQSSNCGSDIPRLIGETRAPSSGALENYFFWGEIKQVEFFDTILTS